MLQDFERVNIRLHALPIEKHLRTEIFTAISKINKSGLPDKGKYVSLKHIVTHPEILNDPSLTTHIANDILKSCEGAFINLQSGRSNPSLNLYFERNRVTLYLKKPDLEATISQALKARFTTIDNDSSTEPMPPPPPRGRGRGRISASASSMTKDLPIHSSLLATKNMKYHVLINGAGGIVTANIYYAHLTTTTLEHSPMQYPTASTKVTTDSKTLWLASRSTMTIVPHKNI
jgi:hypothetical protein